MSSASAGSARVHGHDRVVLGAAGAHEDVLHVEGDRLRALQPGALGEGLLQSCRSSKSASGGSGMCCAPVASTDLGESGAGQEADPVAALGEVTGDGQQRE